LLATFPCSSNRTAAEYTSIGPDIRLSIELFGLNEVVAAVDSVQIFKERLVYHNEVLIHLESLRVVLFKYDPMQTFIVDVVRRVRNLTLEILDPLANPCLVHQV
jgi:hypothetical protein